MNSNPLLGVIFHWLGGLASGSFYVPFRGVKRWSWETYWLVGGVFSWIIAPWAFGLLMSTDLAGVLRDASGSTLFWCYFWGLLWGFGGLTFGLTMRYLGMSLGMAMVLGYCAAFGTLMPPIFNGQFFTMVIGTRSGLVILTGIAVCLIGIVVAGMAGVSKEREMSQEQKKVVIKEFSLKKDRKSTRLNSSHLAKSYAIFCLKKKQVATGHTLGVMPHLTIVAMSRQSQQPNADPRFVLPDCRSELRRPLR